MELKNLDRVQELNRQLAEADATLEAFQNMTSATVQARAYVEGALRRPVWVELLPVPKEAAVGAAARVRSKIVAELQQLGVVI